MHVTVILCTWNRSALLAQALEALARLRPPEEATWDLVVVDNGSTDDTPNVLDGFRSRLPLTVAVEPTPGLSAARNRGLDVARGDYALWTDDDVRPDESWLAEFVAGARRHPGAVVFGGRILPWFPVPPDPDLVAAFPALGVGFCAVDTDAPEGPLPSSVRINGANMAFRTSVARELRFNTEFGPRWGNAVVGDERELIERCRAAGHEPVWLPAMQVRHYVSPERMTLDYLKRYYHDWAVTVVRREGRPPGPMILGVPRWVPAALVRTRVRASLARLTGRRHARFVAEREHAYARGLFDEYRRQAQR